MTLARQNFATECEDALNQQINTELTASYTYQAMAAYFGRDNVALPGFQKYFNDSSEEERGHAQKLINYVNTRGGKVVMKPLQAPESDWKSALNAMESTLQMEKEVNASLLNLHKVAEAQCDAQLCDFLESEFLNEQVEAIKKVSDLLTNLKRVGADGLGLYLFDKELGEEAK